ncbi:hypothetical protein WG915_10800 [Corynebacterium sp. H128]|uniref:hypothetical protein n=1 Tax=Corynebacterium sp. H128 TaxID=3133427 RepID=UPI0030B2CF21
MRANSMTAKILAAGGIGLAALTGTAAFAFAAEPDTPATQQQPDGKDGLAQRLGVSEEQLHEAMDTARQSDAQDRDQVLADALGIDKATVTSAMTEMHSERQTAVREDLSSRIDAAVTEGKLTAVDKESVLKAFDAGLLDPRALKVKGLDRAPGGERGHHGGKREGAEGTALETPAETTAG